jgi:hypothetical protein
VIRDSHVVSTFSGENPVSDEQLKQPQWRIALQELLSDVHPEKINEQAHKVQGLIFERFQQLDKEGDGEAERQALKEALTIVRIIMGDQPQDLEED